jgi:hypothetical protein
MAITQEVVVLNDFGNMRVEERQRTTGAGTSSRYTMTFTGEPIVHDFAAVKLSKIVPEAIAALLKRQVEAITERASEATILKRKYAAAAVKRGASWAVKRYSGGRTGAIAPATASDDRLFNDSGRFAQSIAVMQNPTEEGFTINVAANRLRPETFSGDGFSKMIERLRQLAPAFKGGIEVLQDPAVKDAVEQAKAEWIVNTARAGVARNSEAWKLIGKYAWQYGIKPLVIG